MSQFLCNILRFVTVLDAVLHLLQLRQLIPSLNETVTTSLRTYMAPSQNKPDEEVYAGLPTFHNSRALFQALAKCLPPVGSVTHEDLLKLPARQFLNRLELVAILASVYELVRGFWILMYFIIPPCSVASLIKWQADMIGLGSFHPGMLSMLCLRLPSFPSFTTCLPWQHLRCVQNGQS